MFTFALIAIAFCAGFYTRSKIRLRFKNLGAALALMLIEKVDDDDRY